MLNHCACNSIILYTKIGKPCFKHYLTAKTDNFISDVFYGRLELVRADVRLCVIQYFLGCAVLYKLNKHLALTDILSACSQFSVRKCACTALTELNIALSIKDAAFPEFLHILCSAVNISATLNKNRLCSALRKNECGKKSCRTCTDYNRAYSSLEFFGMVFVLFNNFSIFAFFANLFFIYKKLSLNRCKEKYVVLFSCVNRPFEKRTALKEFLIYIYKLSCFA